MKYLSLIAIFIYALNSNAIFGRTIGLTDWQFWVPVEMMFIGWLDGFFSKK